ncbi:MAG: glycosyl hydrolase 2 galactose-binding domain-containing protein, partial [Chitinophagales bacterium]
MKGVILTGFIFICSVYSYAQQIKYLSENWLMREADSGKWYAAAVPGTVHTDLLAAGLIEDPFYGTNEKKVQWIEEKNWEYKVEFSLTEAE